MIAPSELILNPDGSIYHLHLRPEHIADHVIVVGDPDRVAMVSQYFDSIEYRLQKREFVTHTGYVGKTRITVISSGIGTDNVDILLNELDALVNIDLETREVRPQTAHKRLQMIRIGTSGSLQAEIPIDSFLVSESGIGLDTLNCFYSFGQTPLENNIAQNLQAKLGLPFQPYCVSLRENEWQGSLRLQEQIAFDMLGGNTVSCPGFYGPQGRVVRLDIRNPQFIATLQDFENPYLKGGITNFEMETSAYYAFCRMLGHDMISLNAILANRALNQFSQNPSAIVDKLIRIVLERIEGLKD
ncbi:MAG: nucleoside phosphorylase [Microscillaceae bacterium]|jgi:uridine phosphorylase|nr:nucleoside phosphorylase [Microscillaceae bacterium]